MTAGTTYWLTKQRGRAKPRVLPRALHRSADELFVIPTACGCLHCVPGGLWLPTQMVSYIHVHRRLVVYRDAALP